MAETWTRAFGRYLRNLRERRHLSLHEVSSLSQTFADTLNKGYLSRCENGHQRVAFSKVIPLSRIYEVPSDALLERMELDMELERVGGPETTDMSFGDLTRAGTKALNQGFRWEGYAYLRDALPRAPLDPPMDGFRDDVEQTVCAFMSCAIVADHLGRHRYALHEFLHAKSTGSIGPKFLPILHGRLSNTYRSLGEFDLARRLAEEAVVEAERCNDKEWLGFAYGDRARQALEDSELETAAAFFRKAYESFNDTAREFECARSLHNLAQTYFDLGRYRAARRAISASGKMMERLGQHRTRALGRILLGEIEALEDKDDLAAKRWKEASTIAKDLNDKELRFKAEFLLLEQAHKHGNAPVTRSIIRRLRKLSNWIPKSTPELQAFEDLISRIST